MTFMIKMAQLIAYQLQINVLSFSLLHHAFSLYYPQEPKNWLGRLQS